MPHRPATDGGAKIVPMRDQYASDVRLTPDTYPDKAAERVADTYRTARRGRITLDLARTVWRQNLLPTYERVLLGNLPTQQWAYDQLVIHSALAVQETLARQKRGGFGVGQKVFNLFMKDLWALGLIIPPFEQLLHSPLDRIILARLRNVPRTWSAWSRVVTSGPQASEISDYLGIQNTLRIFLAESPIKFASLIEMEQFLWHRI